MFRRRRAPAQDPRVRAFIDVVRDVEAAKDALVAAVPSARAPGAPLADALFRIEHHLQRARGGMSRWRDHVVSEDWRRCRDGIEEARRRAERLRLEAPDLEFESLLARIAELIDPLEPFEEAARRFRGVGASLD